MIANVYRALLLSSLVGTTFVGAACNTVVARVNPQQISRPAAFRTSCSGRLAMVGL